MSDFWLGMVCGVLIVGIPLAAFTVVLLRALPRWES